MSETQSHKRAKNKKGAADKKPPAGYASWLDFWEKKKENYGCV